MNNSLHIRSGGDEDAIRRVSPLRGFWVEGSRDLLGDEAALLMRRDGSTTTRRDLAACRSFTNSMHVLHIENCGTNANVMSGKSTPHFSRPTTYVNLQGCEMST